VEKFALAENPDTVKLALCVGAGDEST